MELTRTLTSTTVKAYFYDLASNTMGTEEVTASGTDLDAINKRIKKTFEQENKVFCKSEILASVPTIWAVPEDVFLAHAKEVTKRNSAVKMVTRSVSVYVHTVTAFDPSINNLIDIPFVCDTEKTEQVKKAFEKSEQYVGLVYCKSVHTDTKTGTYGMTEDEFLKLAKPSTKRTLEK